MDGVVYDSEKCAEEDSCSITSSGENSSTLTFNTGNMDPVKNMTLMNIVCVVNQTLTVESLAEGQMTEIRLPANNSRIRRSEPVQLRISPAQPTTPPPTDTPRPTTGSDPTPSPGENR